jgi:uncharacterized metal-binding protein YceD (DUF177 family)
MKKPEGSIDKSDPWRVPVMVAKIPETGLHRDIEASAAEREAMAELAGLREILSATASLDVTPKGGGRFHVGGQIRARVGQTCVVTLEPVENEIDESVDLVFAPVDAVPLPADGIGGELEIPYDDGPEPLVDGMIDLGAIAIEFLILAIDPYPRKPDAVFQAPAAGDDSAHPFAVLAALKKEQ